MKVAPSEIGSRRAQLGFQRRKAVAGVFRFGTLLLLVGALQLRQLGSQRFGHCLTVGQLLGQVFVRPQDFLAIRQSLLQCLRMVAMRLDQRAGKSRDLAVIVSRRGLRLCRLRRGCRFGASAVDTIRALLSRLVRRVRLDLLFPGRALEMF